MNIKNFSFTLNEILEKNKASQGGEYKDNELEISVSIMLNETTNKLDFTFLFLKIPYFNPFWAIITIQIRRRKIQYFIDESKKNFQKTFSTYFDSELFSPNTTILYQISVIPPYICTLSNNHELTCYMNSAIQLLFRLAKFRSMLLKLSFPEADTGWLNKLVQLFKKMCSYQGVASTKELTDSFGWPKQARLLKHDPADFIQSILGHIKEKLENNQLDKMFISRVMNYDENRLEEYYVISMNYLLGMNLSFDEKLEKVLEQKKFEQFPEVLFLLTGDLKYDELPMHLDMSSYSNQPIDKDNPRKYILSGIIVYLKRESHYVSYVRGSSSELWIKFDDDKKKVYTWKVNEDGQVGPSPVYDEIGQDLCKSNNQIHLLMYVLKCEVDNYFCFTPGIVSVSMSPRKRKATITNTKLISIITDKDIEKYITYGHADFENINSSIELNCECDPKNPELSSFRHVYELVSEKLNRSMDSFVLRFRKEFGQPSTIFRNDPLSNLSDITIENIKLYLDDLNGVELTSYPFFFLLFKFNSRKFINNLSLNLTHSWHSPKDQVMSTPICKFAHRKIKIKNYSPLTNQNTPCEKESLTYLTKIYLNANSKFGDLTDQILQIINKKDDVKHSKINFYAAAYNNEHIKVRYVKLQPDKTVRAYWTKEIYGCYIYVQCEDDFTEENIYDDLYMNFVKPKFSFFKYKGQVENITYYPKEIVNAFSLENFSVPVTIYKLNDQLNKNKTKTILLPFRNSIDKSVDQLKRIICAIMKETYPEKGLCQIFFSFREDQPPFQEPLFDENDPGSLSKMLEFHLKNSVIKLKLLNFSPYSSTNQICCEEEDAESVTDVIPKIFIFYHIFDHYNREDESIRVYFSADGISILLMNQILVKKNSKVSDVIKNILNIFPEHKLPAKDNELISNIIRNNLNITDYYRIIQTRDGKIVNELSLEDKIRKNMEIRFEPMPKKDENLVGFIPVFFGAIYSATYETDYVGSLGTPFYFPVYKSDLIDEDSKYTFIDRLNKKIEMKKLDYNLIVAKSNGFIQRNVDIDELEIIMEKKLSYCICINDLNASSFIDEVRFFGRDTIRILR